MPRPGWASIARSRKSSTYDVLCGDVGLGQAMQETAVPGLFLAPSTLDLLGVELEIAGAKDRALRLKKAIDELVYDQRCSDLTYILIDCPPSLSLITINAMTAADAVLVPLQCEFFALEGLSQLLKTVEQVRQGLNPRLIIQGVVLTMYDPRNNLSGQVMADVRELPRRQGLRDGDPAQCPGLRGAVLWQAGAALRSALLGVAGLSQAGVGSHQARARAARRSLTDISAGEFKRMAMAEEQGRSRLGRGLAALIGDVGDEIGALERARGQRRVPVEFLRPSARNPRRSFGEEDLEELTASIRERGILQPIIVRSIGGMLDAYEIIAGERRWRAAQRAGLHDVPVILVEADDREALEIAIVENVQRTDLNAIEEAAGYERLIAEFGYTQNDLAQVIGKSRSHVANTLRLSKLPESVRQMVSDGLVSAGHARALLSVSDPELMARRIVDQGLSVRDIERVVQDESREAKRKSVPGKPKPDKDPDTRAVEKALEEALGLSVSISHRANGGGEVKIGYKTLEQLDALCRRLKA